MQEEQQIWVLKLPDEVEGWDMSDHPKPDWDRDYEQGPSDETLLKDPRFCTQSFEAVRRGMVGQRFILLPILR
jgi:hypothetical protein